MFEGIKYLFKRKKLNQLDLREFEWCLVGNIIDKHYFGEDKVIVHGTKQFRPNAKVYIFPEYGGMGHDSINVIGLPRKQRKMITVVINSKMIKNVRLEKIYSSFIKENIKENTYYQNWKKNENEILRLNDFAKYLNSLTEEIK